MFEPVISEIEGTLETMKRRLTEELVEAGSKEGITHAVDRFFATYVKTLSASYSLPNLTCKQQALSECAKKAAKFNHSALLDKAIHNCAFSLCVMDSPGSDEKSFTHTITLLVLPELIVTRRLLGEKAA